LTTVLLRPRTSNSEGMKKSRRPAATTCHDTSRGVRRFSRDRRAACRLRSQSRRSSCFARAGRCIEGPGQSPPCRQRSDGVDVRPLPAAGEAPGLSLGRPWPARRHDSAQPPSLRSLAPSLRPLPRAPSISGAGRMLEIRPPSAPVSVSQHLAPTLSQDYFLGVDPGRMRLEVVDEVAGWLAWIDEHVFDVDAVVVYPRNAIAEFAPSALARHVNRLLVEDGRRPGVLVVLAEGDLEPVSASKAEPVQASRRILQYTPASAAGSMTTAIASGTSTRAASARKGTGSAYRSSENSRAKPTCVRRPHCRRRAVVGLNRRRGVPLRRADVRRSRSQSGFGCIHPSSPHYAAGTTERNRSSSSTTSRIPTVTTGAGTWVRVARRRRPAPSRADAISAERARSACCAPATGFRTTRRDAPVTRRAESRPHPSSVTSQRRSRSRQRRARTRSPSRHDVDHRRGSEAQRPRPELDGAPRDHETTPRRPWRGRNDRDPRRARAARPVFALLRIRASGTLDTDGASAVVERAHGPRALVRRRAYRGCRRRLLVERRPGDHHGARRRSRGCCPRGHAPAGSYSRSAFRRSSHR
jgi:hypothetical protein